MNEGSDHRPLAKWTTGNLIGLLGFIALIVSAWMNLDARVTVLESDARHVQTDSRRMEIEIKSNGEKLDRVLEKISK